MRAQTESGEWDRTGCLSLCEEGQSETTDTTSANLLNRWWMDGWIEREREERQTNDWPALSQRAEVCPDVSSVDGLPCALIRTLLAALACKLSSSLPVSCSGNEAALLWGMLHGEDSSAIWDVVELLSVFDMFKKHLVTQSGPSWRAQLPSPLPASSTGREKIYSGFSVSWLQSKLFECQVQVAAVEELRLRKPYFLIQDS